ncbi:MAG TPA: exonuclease SbcCD subunit D [Acidimicrobiales bacterium]|nr:exonuclease SbcCD subunit D [Acidimicrobiales bacterium]
MRLLHTSDWHVGKLIRGQSRADEHRAVLAEIAGVAATEAVDLVLVAGDLFETSAPGPESEEVVYRALLDLAQVAPVVVIGGNHDNPRRLDAVAPLLSLGRVTVLGRPAAPDDGGVVRLDAGGTPVCLALLPFVSKRLIVKAQDLMADDAYEHSQAYDGRVRAVVGRLCGDFGADTVNLVCAHAFAAGGTTGGGERSVHTVEDYSVGAQAFPVSAQYVALGHLHRAQDIPGPTRIRYSGSPLQLDFGEGRDTKSVTVVELEPGTPAAVREVPLTAGRGLRTLQGSLAELEAVAGSTGDDFLRVVVTDTRRAGLADLVREWFPLCVDVIVRAPDDDRRRPAEAVAGRQPGELFRSYLATTDLADPRVAATFDELLEEVTS